MGLCIHATVIFSHYNEELAKSGSGGRTFYAGLLSSQGGYELVSMGSGFGAIDGSDGSADSRGNRHSCHAQYGSEFR